LGELSAAPVRGASDTTVRSCNASSRQQLTLSASKSSGGNLDAIDRDLQGAQERRHLQLPLARPATRVGTLARTGRNSAARAAGVGELRHGPAVRRAIQCSVGGWHKSGTTAGRESRAWRGSFASHWLGTGFLVGPEWLEHSTYGLRVRCSTNWA